MTPGRVAIYISAVLAVVAFVSAVRWTRGRKEAESTFRLAYLGMTVSLGLAAFFLMLAILFHDFRFAVVANYSSTDLPLLYLISSFWSGQEGSFLLWALMTALVGYPLFRKRSWEPAAVMTTYMVMNAFLIALLLDPSGNPFRLVDQVPPEGRGLNPLLQDPWMAIHPPMVFVGYTTMAVPAALALVALLKRAEERWVGSALRSSLVGFIFLGTGIVMGGFWAYKVLGWGGYWGWDPVENASLVPWLFGTALFHGLLVQKSTGALRRTNLVLALVTYLTVMYSTFLTRSGVLAKFSVHSFPQGTIYRELVVILLIILAVAAFALIRRGQIESPRLDLGFSWPLVLTAVLILFSLSAGIVCLGTSWPMITDLAGKPSTFGPEFYNAANLPLVIGLLGMLGVGPFLAWVPRSAKEWGRRLTIPLAVAIVGTAAAVALGCRGTGALVLFFVALAATTANLWRLLEVARGDLMTAGSSMAHLGFGLMFIGIVASSAWGLKQEVKLPIGRPVDAIGMTLTYRGHVDGSEPRDEWRVALLRPGSAEIDSKVSMFNTAGPGEDPSILRKPTITREIGRDLYVAPLGLEPASEGGPVLDLTKDQPQNLRDATITFRRFESGAEPGGEHMMSVQAIVDITRAGSTETLSLPFAVSASGMEGKPVESKSLEGVALAVDRMAVEQKMVRVRLDDGSGGSPEMLLVEASTKPLIGALWAGTIVLAAGCVIAAIRRYREITTMAAAGIPVPAPAGAGPSRAPVLPTVR